MSSSQTSTSASPSDPTNPGGNGGGGQGPPTTSSSLYLYTFLATLLLLLGISAVIVFRSLLLRRRTRRMIEEAIANGTWIPPAPRSSVKIGDKPSLFDAYTTFAYEKGNLLEKKAKSWTTFKPLSVTFVRSDNARKIEQLEILEASTVTARDRLRSLVSKVTLFVRGHSPPPSPAPYMAAPVEIDSHPPEYKEVTVSVMIAMPTAPEFKRLSNHEHSSSRQECPAVEFGVAHLQLPPGWTLEPSSSPAAGVD